MIALPNVGEHGRTINTERQHEPNVVGVTSLQMTTFEGRGVGGSCARRVQLSEVACHRRLMTCDPLLNACGLDARVP